MNQDKIYKYYTVRRPPDIGSVPKDFVNILKNLACVVYPLLPAKKTKEKAKKGYQYSATTFANNGFSDSVNNTLNNMKKKY